MHGFSIFRIDRFQRRQPASGRQAPQRSEVLWEPACWRSRHPESSGTPQRYHRQQAGSHRPWQQPYRGTDQA
ncbi:hypothetical protein UCMB321_3945 [Pseudomonas batumici]|uniref:Uncharacterized protein n=1 Tax=Pseudomonas batumici TaxID=226910 RepID=A0A0C2E8S9_9PSED|nr:hypothetical protein UCMB321_3945 [Pseudomonas batumici]